ncbi:antigen 5 like allergen Cul n 1 [Culex quinquefasciatus]|uniref:antigen 5 like allergen Cul n 1 n=1 Tax=Culex quinquefasciatus TaxID=7176 RepID=UPI0018E3D630|nr:antigen 5 like allergen Cul n 1 [Culex quinquefasciatus]
MSSTFKFITVIVLTLVNSSLQQSDYCSSTLCPWSGPNIACNGLRTLSPRCGPEAVEIPMNSSYRHLIVDLHNRYRSKIARGKLLGRNQIFPTAARMATMQWDDELAAIASANTRRCVYGHDKCRNSFRYHASGQNIAIRYYYGQTFENDDLMQQFITSWFSEYSDTRVEFIGQYPDNYVGPKIGHFTQIVSDRAISVGCSMVRWISEPWINSYFVCNYAITNIIGYPVYRAGPTCSGCQAGCSLQYPGLCNIGENINPNPW